jgi:hypothetical protein
MILRFAPFDRLSVFVVLGIYQSESLEPDSGEKERTCMKGKIRYTDEPIGKVRVISELLPSPQELALKD